MKINKITKGLVLVTIVSGMLLGGCELIVDFDRTKIPVDTSDVSVPDGAIPDGNTPITEAGSDASEAGSDAGSDAPEDAPADG